MLLEKLDILSEELENVAIYVEGIFWWKPLYLFLKFRSVCATFVRRKEREIENNKKYAESDLGSNVAVRKCPNIRSS